jgi:hypothetical protein
MMEVGLLTMMVEYRLEFCHDNNHIGVIMVTTHAMMKECGGGGVALPCLIRGGIVKFIESKEIRFLCVDAMHSVNRSTVAGKKMSSADLLSNSLSSVDVPIHSLPPSQSHQGKKNTAQLPKR